MAVKLVVDDVKTVPRDEFIGILERHIQVIQNNMPMLISCGDDPSKWKRSIQSAEAMMRRPKNFPETFEAGVRNIKITVIGNRGS